MSAGVRNTREAVGTTLAGLATLSSAELGEDWLRLVGEPIPRISPRLMRLALAWEVQAKVHGGLSRETQRTLAQLSARKTVTRVASPGMRLVRAWQGRTHVVVIGEDGVIRWNDRDWGSLSEVARTITGTRWSGPAFFGLKKRIAA